jgi:hypothetical protein
MKKLFLILSVFSFNLNAGEKIITELDFTKSLSEIKNAAKEAKYDKLDIESEKTGTYIQLSGYLNLSGNFWMPQNGGFVSTTLYGWLQMRDNTGKFITDNQYVSVYCSFWANPNQFISQTVYPNISMSVYKEGKYIGNIYTNGSINISGWGNSNYVSLNGSGYLTANLYVTE